MSEKSTQIHMHATMSPHDSRAILWVSPTGVVLACEDDHYNCYLNRQEALELAKAILEHNTPGYVLRIKHEQGPMGDTEGYER